MSLISILTCGSLGFAVQLLSNGIRKVPLSRQPWNHLFWGLGGCYVGYRIPSWENKVKTMNEEKEGIQKIMKE